MPARALAWLALLLVAALLPACAVAPERRSPSTLDVVTLNLWHDKPKWPRRRELIVAELAALSPDAILLQEVLQDEGLPNQAQDIATRLGYAYRFFSVDAPGKERRYGNAILVRGEILESRQVALAPLGDYRNAGWVRTLVGGKPLNLYVTHLHHTAAGHATRARQVDGLLALVASTAENAPAVIGGDFNARADSPELSALKPRFLDAYLQAHGAEDVDAPAHSTLNVHIGHEPARIDHVLAGRDAFRVVDARLVLNQADASGAWPSDHHGVWVRLERRAD